MSEHVRRFRIGERAQLKRRPDTAGEVVSTDTFGRFGFATIRLDQPFEKPGLQRRTSYRAGNRALEAAS